ncbi:ABC transporter ATP-binding protein [Tardiphaga alba]|uniref:Spermidine/putrescine import ATP-binding protein PotA n=1 Tax=Tardiphaga alba TaxID=340268 RepID=A0ABX8AGR5_9BRAD|nr:ABC transporter ATP-binding protein [Tardiphaga alba]QUS41583.1 ABC transporter ATP-binding protein [Tardiphaga alba]
MTNPADTIDIPADDDRAIAYPTPLLRIDTVSKRFGTHVAADELSLDIREGEFFALLGPSGCGKTTLLRMLAGFETPDSGRIELNGEDIAAVPPHQRPVNMMFQNYALFPHLSVRDNIGFGLKNAGLTRIGIDARVADMISLVKLNGLEQRKPHQLSGGQKQRVALARALARHPKLLLLDEPLAALDKKLREETQTELIRLQRQLGLTFVIVTHDQDEAMSMADRIGVMHGGRLQQLATPRQLYEAPASRWVAEFVGDINLVEGEIRLQDGHRLTVEGKGTGTLFATMPAEPVDGLAICIAIRPEKIRLSRRGLAAGLNHSGGMNSIEGLVDEVDYLGGRSVYRLKLDHGATLRVALANTTRLDVDAYGIGERVTAWFTPDDCVVLPR